MYNQWYDTSILQLLPFFFLSSPLPTTKGAADNIRSILYGVSVFVFSLLTLVGLF